MAELSGQFAGGVEGVAELSGQFVGGCGGSGRAQWSVCRWMCRKWLSSVVSL